MDWSLRREKKYRGRTASADPDSYNPRDRLSTESRTVPNLTMSLTVTLFDGNSVHIGAHNLANAGGPIIDVKFEDGTCCLSDKYYWNVTFRNPRIVVFQDAKR